MRVGSCLLRSSQHAGTGAASREEQSSVTIDFLCKKYTWGRTFQLGEGWHSSENARRSWNLSPRFPKEVEARCSA
jgi:hypothetical protein